MPRVYFLVRHGQPVLDQDGARLAGTADAKAEASRRALGNTPYNLSACGL